ncbi:uncharacterized protein LOC126993667 isoform X2 [Eriocheir sinensis]|uniref:uncharacterized protein LOC126993667 isoform X2 n=1 Tax=Eriocheir sinensis TaxID=95602 RepID=UPI0021C8BD41|nr:uncharacterized protein LOC126993667 isoform X2 [Eriocheir sinensis]
MGKNWLSTTIWQRWTGRDPDQHGAGFYQLFVTQDKQFAIGRAMSEVSDVEKAVRSLNANLFRPGVTQEEIRAGYDELSETYDEVMLRNTQYHALDITVEEVLRRVTPEKRAQTRVLDVAAGTGRVGRELYREGFRLLDAVEPSQGMINKLRESGVYTNDFMDFIGSGNSSMPKGGLVVIVMRLEFLESVAAYRDKLEPYMDQLEEEGKWRKTERRVVANYFFDKEGIVYTYRVI